MTVSGFTNAMQYTMVGLICFFATMHVLLPLLTVEQPSNIPVDPVEIKEPPPPFEPERLLNQIDRAIGDHRTSSSMINAVVGGIPTHGTVHGVSYNLQDLHSYLPSTSINTIAIFSANSILQPLQESKGTFIIKFSFPFPSQS